MTRTPLYEIPQIPDEEEDDDYAPMPEEEEEDMPLLPDTPNLDAPDSKRKRGRPVGSKSSKLPRVRLSSREKIIGAVAAAVNKSGVPNPKDMFKMMPEGQRKVKLGQLAIFCNRDAAAALKGSSWHEAIAVIAGSSGGNNIVNLHSEIRLDRVKLILRALLETGYMVHDIKVCLLSTVPDGIENNPKVYQVVSGRHRLVAMYLLYGPMFEIPVTVIGTAMDYETACYATIVSNDTREMGKTETVFFKGLMREFASADEIETEFKGCRGKLKNIVDFAAFHSVIRKDLLVATDIPVTDKAQKGSYTMTLVNWKNGIGAILSAIAVETPTVTTDWGDAHGALNVAIAVWNSMFNTIKTLAPDSPIISNAWTSYGSTVIGKILGDAIRVTISAGVAFTPEEIARITTRTGEVVLAYLRNNNGGKNFAHLPPAELYESVASFAKTFGKPILVVPKKTIRF